MTNSHKHDFPDITMDQQFYLNKQEAIGEDLDNEDQNSKMEMYEEDEINNQSQYLEEE